MTDTVDIGQQMAGRRLDPLHRRSAERHSRSADATAASPAGTLSDGPRTMWATQAADLTCATLNICSSHRLSGDVDVEQLHKAVNAVAARHPVLRTTYTADAQGEPQPTVHDDLTPGWAVHDLTALSAHARRLRLEVLAQRHFGTAFDLGGESPLRLTVVRTAHDEHILLLVAHPIAWDDACERIFFADLTRAYRGERLPTAAAASTRWATGSPGDSIDYWRRELADPPEPLELPGPNGSAVPSIWRARRTVVQLSDATIDGVSALSVATGATPYTVLLAAFAVLIHRYTHAEDFLVATPVLNRADGMDDAIGCFGGTVAVRLRPQSRQTFREVLAQTRDTAEGAFAHRCADLTRVLRESPSKHRCGVEQMVRVGFDARDRDGDGFNPPGVTCRRTRLRGQLGRLPLAVTVQPDGSAPGLEVEAEYLVEILDDALARQLLEHYVVVLEDALRDPDRPIGRLAVMPPVEADWLHRISAGQQIDTTATTLTALVQGQVARTPDAVALVHEHRRYTYRELNAAANRVAHWLIGQGIGTEDRVAVLLDRSPEQVITALGVLKAGAVYLPVDPTHQADRLAFILADSGPKLVVREPLTAIDGYPGTDPTDADRVRPLRADNTAYLTYTSGSTGRPKGILVPHRPVAEYLVWFNGEFGIDERERLLQVSSPGFDASIGEIFGMLTSGGRLVIPRADGLRDVGYLTDLLHSEGITSMHPLPSLLGLFLSLPGVNQWRTVKRVPVGGETLPGALADKFHATFDAQLQNFYGPAETVITASWFDVQGRQGTRVVPIGKPKINTQIYLLDTALQPVPVGVIGEIYIGGGHLARGYHNRAGLTAERFVADPFVAGARLYRSGDLARRNADGDIEFVGRADEQGKIGGVRIELGEVAAAMSVDPSVGQALVVVTDLPGVGPSVVGYLTPAAEATDVDVERIRDRVAAALPDYMIPAAYVVVDDIPTTTHGKIDHAALPVPDIATRAEHRRTPRAGSVVAHREHSCRQLAAQDAGLLPDFPRPRVLSGDRDCVSFDLDAAMRATLARLAAEADITEYTLLRSAVAVTSHKAGCSCELAVLNRAEHDNPTLREVLRRARDSEAGSHGHSAPTVGERFFDTGHDVLSVGFFDTDGGYRAELTFRTDLYRRPTAERFVGWLQRVLSAFADDCGQRVRDVQLADRAERRRVETFSAAARASVLDHWCDATAIGVVGDVYVHVAGPNGPVLERAGKRGRWTADGRLQFV